VPHAVPHSLAVESSSSIVLTHDYTYKAETAAKYAVFWQIPAFIVIRKTTFINRNSVTSLVENSVT